MARKDAIAHSLVRFEQGLASAAVEGQYLEPDDEAYARALIEAGLSVEEQGAAMDAYFDAHPLKGRFAGSR